MVFDREGSEIAFGASINKASINRSVNPKMPYLSFLAINYDIPVIVEVQKWFESCIVRNYANPTADRQIMLSDDETFRERIIQALNDVDIDMTGYRYDDEKQELYTQRRIAGKDYELKFSDESDGTKNDCSITGNSACFAGRTAGYHCFDKSSLNGLTPL